MAESRLQHASFGQTALERAGDGLRLLEDFLLHVVAVITALHRVGGQLTNALGTIHWSAIGVEDTRAIFGDLDEIAVLKNAEPLGHRHQRGDIRSDEVLALAVADDQGAAQARADDPLRHVAVDDADGVGAFETVDRRSDGVEQVHPLLAVKENQPGDDLGIGVGVETDALGLQLPP